MQRLHIPRAFYFASCLALLASHADADPALTSMPATVAISPGESYLSVAVGGQAYDLPRFNSYQLSTGGDLFSVVPQVSGVAGALAFGTMLPQGLLGSIGDRPRLEFLVTGLEASGSDTASITGPFHQIFTSIDGSQSGFGNLVKNAYSATLKTRFQALEFGPRLKFDRSITPDIVVTPSAALLFGVDQSKYDYSFVFTTAGGNLPGYVREAVDSQRFGPELGIDVTWQAAPLWTIHGGVSAALYGQHSSFSGTDCATNVPLSGTSCDGTIFATTASGRGSNLGARLSPSIGASYQWGNVVLSTIVNATWTVNQPGVTNPNVGGQRAALMYQNRWGYGGMMQVMIPLL
jgi:hypothetical protein